jgi:hypothetical protein
MTRELQLDEDQARLDLDNVSKFSDKNQRLAWRRKRTKMDELLAKILPYEEQILEIIYEKQSIMDDIEVVRKAMVKECVHPADYLVHKGNFILCKFCKNKIVINNGK